MKIRNLRAKVIAPVLLLIPMACMHLGDGHHDGGHHSSIRQPSYQYTTYELVASNPSENFATRQNSIGAQEETETQPEGEKRG